MNEESRATPASDELTDRDRLDRIAAGDVAALRAFYDAHARRVQAFAAKMLGDVHEAEDVVQEVFVRVWKKACDYDYRRGSPWGWIAIMTRSACIDRLRRRQVRPALSTIDASNMHAGETPAESGSAQGLNGADVDTLLERLRPAERQCLVKVFFGGLTHAEVAKQDGIPLGTVKTNVRRALQRLRELLSLHDS